MHISVVLNTGGGMLFTCVQTHTLMAHTVRQLFFTLLCLLDAMHNESFIVFKLTIFNTSLSSLSLLSSFLIKGAI